MELVTGIAQTGVCCCYQILKQATKITYRGNSFVIFRRFYPALKFGFSPIRGVDVKTTLNYNKKVRYFSEL